MAHKLHHPELMKIRNRWHLARRHKDWPTIKALVATDDPDDLAKARELARKAVASPRRVKAMQAGARVALARKVAFLRVQMAKEKTIRAALRDLSDKLAALVARASGKDGKVAPGRLHAILNAMKAENRNAYARVNRIFLGLVKAGARGGILAAMATATAVQDDLKASREKAAKTTENADDTVQPTGRPVPPHPHALVEKSASPSSLLDGGYPVDKSAPGKSLDEEVIHKISTVQPTGQPNYNNLSSPLDESSSPLDSQLAPYKVLKERKERERAEPRALIEIFLREDDDTEDPEEDGPDPARQTVSYAVDSGVFQKIFTGAMKQTMEAGLFGDTGVSNKVWDLRDQNLLILKRLVAAGIANGDSAGTIASSIQDLLVQPAGFDYSYSGPGIYKSAYKNALRLARNESNRAYGSAQALFASQKEWNIIWHVSEGQREEDECDDLDGVEMTPEEYMDAYPQHPNCMCYSTLAVPEYGDDGASDDEPGDSDDAAAAD